MSFKRVLSGLLGLPIVALVLIFGNKYIIDIFLSVIAIISMHEYINCVSKKVKPVKWIGYLLSIGIAFIHIIPVWFFKEYLPLILLSILVILFMTIIITEMKTNIIDIAMSLLGYIYIVGFIAFLSLLYGIENVGKYYIWYIFFASWGCDVFAFYIGSKFGKHKFSKISPKKSIEGCIAGTLGGVILTIAYTAVLNNFLGMNINYFIMGAIGLALTILGQIGDFAASSIKRYSDIKDFSNLIPGHGGMIDRIDSVIFAAPFAYYLIQLFIL